MKVVFLSMIERLKFCKMKISEKSIQQLKLFQEGERMLEKDMSIEKLIKDMRDIKIIIKEKFNHNFKNELQYHQRNLIDLDSLLAEEESQGLKSIPSQVVEKTKLVDQTHISDMILESINDEPPLDDENRENKAYR